MRRREPSAFKRALRKARPIMILALIVGGVWLGLVKFESEKPALSLVPDAPVLGREFGFRVEDRKSGLSEIRVEAIQAGLAVELFVGSYPKDTHAVEQTLLLSPLPGGLKEGEILLRLSARDRSWKGGNPAVLERKMILDTLPPRAGVLGGPHYINQGGSGFVAFSANEEIAAGGIQAGDRFFPGDPGGDGRWTVLFALPPGADPATPFFGTAKDLAGNEANFAFRPYVRPRAFRRDTIQVTDAFLAGVAAYFKAVDPGLPGTDLEIYLTLNRDQRRKDDEKIRDICRDTAPRRLWSGAFLRLPNSKPMARFADERTYLYRGREIDRQTHLGVDLASVARCPVPAANAGRVVFAEALGIYGETVMLDHGGGLFSMYSHLSRIEVEVGAEAARGGVLGWSGMTGLAGGDHLHFAMLVHGVFVDPVEWWDDHWIRDNIEIKAR